MTSRFTEEITGQPPSFDFVAAHFACESNLYSPSNPEGYINFGSAQNFMHSEQMGQLLADANWNDEGHRYQPFHGTEACRQAVAGFINRTTPSHNRAIDADQVVIGNGVISLLEALAISLLDPGDSILVPTPVFPGLIGALRTRMRFDVKFLHTGPETDFRLRPEALQSRLRELKASGTPIKAVLLCSPGNPVGQVFSAAELKRFAEIAEQHDCDLIVDEVYAGSVFEGQRFVSAASIDSDRVHLLGGLSKDFGLAGYATGWLATRHAGLLAALRKQSHFFRLPSPIQSVITSVLTGDRCDAYLTHHRGRLSERGAEAKEALLAMGTKVADCEAGLCLWIDLRDHLPELTPEAEFELYQRMLNQHRVHVSPGSGFLTNQFGFFRICFTQDESTLAEGLRRMEAALNHSDAISKSLTLSTEAI